MPNLADGTIIHSLGAQHVAPHQTITGSFVDAATAANQDANAKQAAAYKSLGAGQKGGALGASMTPSNLPSAGSIGGVSPDLNRLNGVNHLNKIRADALGDGDLGAQPKQVGGRSRRSRRSRRTTQGKQGKPAKRTERKKKTTRKVKKHGRSDNRNHRGKHSRSSTRRRISRMVV